LLSVKTCGECGLEVEGMPCTSCDGNRLVVHATAAPAVVTARVTWVHDGGVRAEIGWTRPSGANGTEDALDLARRCVSAWERFFQQHALDPAA
jgi:hypothetical protein